MTPTEFLLWLNGALDITADEAPTKQQWDIVRQTAARALAEGVAKKFQEAQYGISRVTQPIDPFVLAKSQLQQVQQAQSQLLTSTSTTAGAATGISQFYASAGAKNNGC